MEVYVASLPRTLFWQLYNAKKFVADQGGKPIDVPELVPEIDEEKELHAGFVITAFSTNV